MSISQVRCQSCSGSLVRPGRIKGLFKSFGPCATPGPTMPLLTSRLAERRSPHQGLTRIGPTIRMGVVGVVDFKIVLQTGGKILGRTAIASFEKSTGQDAQPQLHLVKPGAMFRRKMAHMLVSRIAQERPPLCPST